MTGGAIFTADILCDHYYNHPPYVELLPYTGFIILGIFIAHMVTQLKQSDIIQHLGVKILDYCIIFM